MLPRNVASHCHGLVGCQTPRQKQALSMVKCQNDFDTGTVLHDSTESTVIVKPAIASSYPEKHAKE